MEEDESDEWLHVELVDRSGGCRDRLESPVPIVGQRIDIVPGLDHLEGMGQPAVVAIFKLMLAKLGLDHSAFKVILG